MGDTEALLPLPRGMVMGATAVTAVVCDAVVVAEVGAVVFTAVTTGALAGFCC